MLPSILLLRAAVTALGIATSNSTKTPTPHLDVLLQAGCDDGQGPLPYQGCRLLAAANCTLPLEVTARLQGAQATTAGALQLEFKACLRAPRLARKPRAPLLPHPTHMSRR